MCDLYLYILASPKSSKGIPEGMSSSPLLGLHLKYSILTQWKLWHICGYLFISVSKKKKGVVQGPMEICIFLKIWRLANSVLLFFTLELRLRMRTSSDYISVTACDNMHSPAVSRGNDILIVYMNFICPEQKHFPKIRTRNESEVAMLWQTLLGIPSTVRESGTGSRCMTSWVLNLNQMPQQPDYFFILPAVWTAHDAIWELQAVEADTSAAGINVYCCLSWKAPEGKGSTEQFFPVALSYTFLSLDARIS